MTKYSLHEPLLGKQEKTYVENCLQTAWLSPSGKYVKIFESTLEKITKKKVICCNSGTSALHISLILAGVKSSEEVIVPTITFISTINAVIYLKASPIFMDCKEDLLVDTDKIINFLKTKTYKKNNNTFNKKTKKKISAIIITHVFGNLVDIKKLKNECKKRGVKLIEDAAEALGSQYKNNIHAGSIGDFGILSFNINKIITTGGGGAILLNNSFQKKKAKLLINQSKVDNIYFKHQEAGFNYGLSNVNAAIGLGQIKKLQNILKKKNKIYKIYKKKFLKEKNIKLITEPNYQKSNKWLNFILIKNIEYSNFKQVIKNLIDKNVEVRPVWYPCHLQNYLKKFERYKIDVANKIYKKIICLPSSYFLTSKDINKITEIIKNVVKKK